MEGGSLNPRKYKKTSVLLCIYMHRLKWSVIAKQSICLKDPISMLLSQLLSQLRSQFSFASNMFEAIGMEIMSSSRVCLFGAIGLGILSRPRADTQPPKVERVVHVDTAVFSDMSFRGDFMHQSAMSWLKPES